MEKINNFLLSSKCSNFVDSLALRLFCAIYGYIFVLTYGIICAKPFKDASSALTLATSTICTFLIICTIMPIIASITYYLQSSKSYISSINEYTLENVPKLTNKKALKVMSLAIFCNMFYFVATVILNIVIFDANIKLFAKILFLFAPFLFLLMFISYSRKYILEEIWDKLTEEIRYIILSMTYNQTYTPFLEITREKLTFCIIKQNIANELEKLEHFDILPIDKKEYLIKTASYKVCEYYSRIISNSNYYNKKS